MSHDEKVNKNDSTFVRSHEVQSGTHAQGAASEQVNPAAAVQRVMSGTASPADVVQLQRTIGNRAVTGMIQRYSVTAANNPKEQEADAIGRKILESGNIQAKRAPVIQRAGDDKPKPAVGLEGGTISGDVQSAVDNAVSKSGDSLPDNIQRGAASATGYDVSDTKVVQDETSNALLGSTAYSIGNTIVTTPGVDESTLAHETVHAAQNKAAAGVAQLSRDEIQAKFIQRDLNDEIQEKRIQRDTEGLEEESSIGLKRIQRNTDLDEEEI
jgi:hypothetical protein